jgi:thiol:disulfide interchange protein DsbD
MGAFEPLHVESPRSPKAITKSIGIIIFMYGAALFFGGISGATNPLAPLSEFTAKTQVSTTTSVTEASFKKIHSIKELDAILAKSKGKKVMLDFYADWCVSCKELEHNTFSDAKVKAKLSEFVLIQADVTANSEDEKALSKKYGVFGPPAILFFDKSGVLLKSRTIVGYQDPEPFLKHINKI